MRKSDRTEKYTNLTFNQSIGIAAYLRQITTRLLDLTEKFYSIGIRRISTGYHVNAPASAFWMSSFNTPHRKERKKERKKER